MVDLLSGRQDRRIAIVLFGTQFTAAISQSFIFAVLPVLGRRLGVSDLGIGLVASLPALAYVLAAPVLGSLVDRLGSLLLIRIGMIAGVASNLAFAVTISLATEGLLSAPTTLAFLLASRLVLNVAWGGMFPAAAAYAALSTTASRRIGGMALLASASGIGLIAGPIIPTLVSHLSSVAPFYTVAALTALSLVSTWLVKPMKVPLQDQKRHVSAVKMLTGETAPYFAVALLLLICMTMVQQLTAFQMQDTLHLSSAQSAAEAGRLLTLTAMAMLLGQWSIAFGGKGVGAHKLVAIGAGSGFFSMLSLGCGVAVASLAPFYVASALFGLAMGILLPTNAGSLSLSLPDVAQGQAAGFLGSAQGSGRIVGPLLATVLYAVTPSGAYWCGAAAFIVIAWLGIRSALQSKRVAASAQ